MSLEPERVWQSVLDQLQMEMPRASFDTWVKDTRVLSFDSGALIVGARNACARDWLESRLASTVRRRLVGILSRQVEVSFVVMSETEAGADVEDPADGGGFTAEPVEATRYRDEVHPDHIVLLDAYCLRLLAHGDMTAKEMSLWVGFRQAAWRQWKEDRTGNSAQHPTLEGDGVRHDEPCILLPGAVRQDLSRGRPRRARSGGALSPPKHRAGAYDELAQSYQTRFPGQQVKNGICFYTEAGVQLLAGFPTAGMYALAGMYPALKAGVDQRDLRDGLVPDVAGWLEFLPAWWETYEKIVSQMAKHATDGPVPYCRIVPS